MSDTTLDLPQLDINLDCEVDPAELNKLRVELLAAAETFNQLARYAELKEVAMTMRRKGDIVRAAYYENNCEKIYEALPEWARW